MFLQLPAITPLPAATVTRPLALIEKMGMGYDADGSHAGRPDGGAARHGRSEHRRRSRWTERMWMEPVTENPAVGATEVWEFYNTTADAHPMHVHEVVFEVVNREGLVLDADGDVVQPIQLDGIITPAGAVGDRLQGHRHRLPGPGHPHPRPVHHAGPVRLALPHRRARGQRDDAAVPHWAGAARTADAHAASARRDVARPAPWQIGSCALCRTDPPARRRADHNE